MTTPSASRRRLIGTATAKVPGACGELVQGYIDGRHFHVTCPIDFYSTVRVELLPGSGRVVAPADCPKARRAVEAALAHLRRVDVDAKLSIESPLPREKGMASSTADVVGAIKATAAALGKGLAPGDVALLAVSIEPSDGLMLEGIALFDHRTASLMESLGAPPPMRILILDFGGEVETLSFNAVDRSAQLAARESKWREALSLVRDGLRRGEAALIAQGATLSARTHQEIVPHPHFTDALAFAKKVDALGVNIAHSGTVIGLLFDDDAARVTRAEADARATLIALQKTYATRLIGVQPMRRATSRARAWL